MSFDKYHRRKGEKQNSYHASSRGIFDNTSDSRVPSNFNPSLEHVWQYDPAEKYDSFGFGTCPMHGSSRTIWRPVKQKSRESRAVYEHDFKPPCPVHQNIANVGSIHSFGGTNTAVIADEIITIEPDQKPEEKLAQEAERKPEPHLHKPCVNRSWQDFERPQTTLYSQYLWYYLKTFYNQYPRPALMLAVSILLYLFINQLDFTIAHIFECFIRIIYPASHYIAVTNEQFFARLSRMATRSDEMVEAFYCDFARSWCQRFELMCEVRCSFVEQTLQRVRKYPH
ncbi:hypothetical protein DICVIV_07418 [Dictyocaulus viviparus]|uniref:Uncharacterized protein n=1 Tax=Dictyocaulus viviparus TaxID=29172 RepID=A0A0D8XRY2_DICVI|nr:hypothetical protein DICVIV_07418 [Dictyocaulus viviparus]